MTAVMSGGTIPDTGDYTVILEPQATTIGNVNEDFAIESMRSPARIVPYSSLWMR